MSNQQGPGGPVKRPRTFDEAVREHQATPEERAALEAKEGPEGAPLPEAVLVTPEQLDRGDVPDWVVFPQDGRYQIPRGEDVIFMRFLARWCKASARHKGDRVCSMWPITAAEERLAVIRARGESGLILTERAKASVRSVDHHTADWSGLHREGSVDKFWDDLGPKCRPLVINSYNKLHTLAPEDYVTFFSECFVSRSTGA